MRTTTAFRPDRKLILLRGQLWGPLGPINLRLAFDPGATITLIIPAALDIVGYSPLDGDKISFATGVVEEQAGYEIRVRRFAALGFEFGNFLVNAQDLHERAGIHGLLGLVVAVFVLFAAAPACAEEIAIGPSNCFQAAESINEKLAALGGVGRGPVPDEDAPARVARSPRHCFFKARELFAQVQALRALKGLAAARLADVPPGELKPQDVLQVLRASHAALAELDPRFPAAKAPRAVALVQGKTPTDVFYSIEEAQRRLAQLGGPAIGPSDCYRMALCVQAGIESLRAARKVSAPVQAPVPATGKKPANCYAQARGLLEDLAAAAVGELTVPGGIPVPGARRGNTAPGHVHALLSGAAADVAAMAAKAGGATPVRLPELVPGKTPSDVFSQIVRARHLARSLIQPAKGSAAPRSP